MYGATAAPRQEGGPRNSKNENVSASGSGQGRARREAVESWGQNKILLCKLSNQRGACGAASVSFAHQSFDTSPPFSTLPGSQSAWVWVQIVTFQCISHLVNI